MKVWAVIYFGLGQCPHLLLHCRTSLQSLWPACCEKGCPFCARTLPFSKTVLTAAACKELQSSHSTPPVGKAQVLERKGVLQLVCQMKRMHSCFLKAVARRSLTWGLETATNSLAGLFLPSVSLQGFRHFLLKQINLGKGLCLLFLPPATIWWPFSKRPDGFHKNIPPQITFFGASLFLWPLVVFGCWVCCVCLHLHLHTYLLSPASWSFKSPSGKI